MPCLAPWLGIVFLYLSSSVHRPPPWHHLLFLRCASSFCLASFFFTFLLPCLVFPLGIIFFYLFIAMLCSYPWYSFLLLCIVPRLGIISLYFSFAMLRPLAWHDFLQILWVPCLHDLLGIFFFACPGPCLIFSFTVLNVFGLPPSGHNFLLLF